MSDSIYCPKCRTYKPAPEFGIRPSSEKRKVWCQLCCKESGRVSRKNRRQERGRNALGRSYASRNENLRRLGFRSYYEYLKSELWQQIRRKVYKAKGRFCYMCGAPATELHHNRYHTNDLTGKKIRYINPVCRGCHKGIEFDQDEKVELRSAAKSFNKARKQRKRKAKKAATGRALPSFAPHTMRSS